MNKKNVVLLTLLDLVLLIMFNVIFFTLGNKDTRTFSTYIPYVFVDISFLIIFLSPIFVKNITNITFFNIPFYLISSIYYVVSMIICTFLIIFKANYKVSIITNIVLMGIYFLFMILTILVNENREKIDNTKKKILNKKEKKAISEEEHNENK